MNKRPLGNTGISLSECGYGCAALFGKKVLGKEGISEEQAYQLILTAVNKDVNFFDTGFNYGFAEERLGRCIRRLLDEHVITRDQIVIETKCGETLKEDGSYGEYDWSPEWIRKSVEISMERLGIDHIDMLAMHGGDASACTDALLNTFEDLKRQGVIGAYGVNTFDDPFLEWIAEKQCFDYVMLDYNVMKRSHEAIIQRLHDNNIGVLAGAALGQALFKKRNIKSRNDLWYYLRSVKNFSEWRKKGKQMDFLNSDPDHTANQLALRYVLDNPNITSAVFNTTSVEHLTENLKAAEIALPDTIRSQIMMRS